jgi:hypothetical protein
LSDIIVYDIDKNAWDELHTEGTHFEGRRYHTVCLVGKQIIAYGGMNDHNQYLSDISSLTLGKTEKEKDFVIYRWMNLFLEKKDDKPKKVAFHSCALVMHPDKLRMIGNGLLLASIPVRKQFLHIISPSRSAWQEPKNKDRRCIFLRWPR